MLAGRQFQQSLHRRIVERPHDGAAQAKGGGLQQQVLAGVAHLDVHIVDPALAVFACAASGNRGDDHRCRRFGDPALVQRGTGQGGAQVAPDGACQSVLCRIVAVASGREPRHLAGQQEQLQGGRVRR